MSDDFFMTNKVEPVAPSKVKTVEIGKRKWPKRPWPAAEVQQVVGLHPSIVAWKHGPHFLLQVAYENKEVVERCRFQLEEQGIPVSPAKNVCYVMPDGKEVWWLSLGQQLLEEVDRMSWPTCLDDMVGPAGSPIHTTARKERLAKLAMEVLQALAVTTKEQSKAALDGNYIPMSSVDPVKLSRIYKGQSISFADMVHQLTETLETEPEESI